MNELDSKSRALLRATQFADEPSQDDYDRVHAAVSARIVVGLATGAAVTTVARTLSAAPAKVAVAVGATSGTSAAAMAPVVAPVATAASVAPAAVVAPAVASVVAAAPVAHVASVAGASIAPAAAASGVLATATTGIASSLPVAKLVAWVVVATVTVGAGTGAVVASRHDQQRAPTMVASTTGSVEVDGRLASKRGAVGAAHGGESAGAVAPTIAASAVAVVPEVPVPTGSESVALAKKGAAQVSAPSPRRETPTQSAASFAPSSSASTLEAEVGLIRDARAALTRGAANEALGVLAEHARLYPNGALGEDRAALHVFALCALGRAESARNEAATFLSVHAASPYASAVRASCVPGGQSETAASQK